MIYFCHMTCASLVVVGNLYILFIIHMILVVNFTFYTLEFLQKGTKEVIERFCGVFSLV